MTQTANADTLTPAQLSSYLARIGFKSASNDASAALPTLETLERVQHLQLHSIPYENLSLHWRMPEAIGGAACSLAPADLVEKMCLGGTRGGYCLELNGLLARALRALGFQVTVCTAAVVYDAAVESNSNTQRSEAENEDAEDDLSSALEAQAWPTHTLLLVSSTAMEDSYLVDIGLAKYSLTEPILIQDKALGAGIMGKQFRLRLATNPSDADPTWILQIKTPSDPSVPWKSYYRFSATAADPAAVDQINTWMSRAPESLTPQVPFATMLIAGIGQVSIMGTEVEIRKGPSDVERWKIADVDEELEREMKQWFGVAGFRDGGVVRVRVRETPAPAW
ncbi:uncharacterized protein EV422DRAFT_508360 [Fimicolochytrium jonesii]|uniref:uncharacterized protein n=1 Tax=Fimicolochytrium jonesii TaxID=1396493 RepID=UPI0022FDE095|nr:uncharacterized protein EV422DRAFT_508360 [Fimicolochytrium jonesii]KAI8818142.1 hypothetical protein EV422DRAFT_508360 [Fimicolochytrium jonesii]